MREDDVRISVGGYTLLAKLERAAAPATCAAFTAMLPFESRLIQARWSGESGWIPLGDLDTGVPAENQTSLPEPGEILLYPGGVSETEILFPYGVARFACVRGELSGNHFLTVTQGAEHLAALGTLVLWSGAQDIRFELA
jgi:Protein of unknown function (DUF3830)